MNIPHRMGLSALILAMAVVLQACDKPAGEGVAAAKVNGATISTAMLEHEAKKLGEMSAEQRKQASGQLLRNLVDQDLLAQKAVAEKLDQNAEVLLALEEARRRVLAQAYVDKLTAGVAAPTEQEITDYFNQHPELFSERRLYRLQEISIQVTPDNVETVKARLTGTNNLNELVAWLKAQQIPARVTQTAKAAEQLPGEILPRLARMKDGQAMTVNAPNSLNILVMAGSQLQPVTLEQARGSIARFLANGKKRDAAAAALKDIRAQAKIEFLGEYAGLAQAPAQEAPKTGPAAAPDVPAGDATVAPK